MEKTKATLKAADYVHLHNHTQYSLLDGLTKVPALVDRVKKMGMDSVAMTDHGTMSGVIEFYKAAKVGGIKPIIGMEAYVAPRKFTDKDPSHDRQYFHLTLIARNNQGYQNLMRLTTKANIEGFYYKPRIDHDLLEKYKDGLIVLSGCIGGEVGDALRQGQYEQAKKIASWYKKVFGEYYYLELMDHGHPEHDAVWAEQTRVNESLLKLANELALPTVVTCDAHYLMHEDQEAHEILLCVQTGSFLTDEKRFSLKDFHLHVEDPKQIIKRWKKIDPQLITNTKKIADLCDVSIELDNILIPKFPVPKGLTEKSFLDNMVWQGLAWRYGGKTYEESSKLSIAEARKILSKEVVERTDFELGIVNSMGFNGYFLIVSDFINWGKNEGIVFGPGRGSAASSILAFSLRITEIDPLKYDLLFERFLNPDRISMPDIDIDIQDTRRDEVINYCVEKYGSDRVANIVTFGRMAARNSVRDVARVLQVPYADADRLAKLIPPPVQGRHIPLEKSLKKVPELKIENDTNEQSRRVFDLATKLEGTIRSHGVHAAGVVIAPDEIVKFAPLEVAQKGTIATQYSMGPVEELGLLKMDFLGLSNLTTIKNTLRIIKRVDGKDIDINKIPLDDKKTFDLLQKADTTGVFQLESAGMKRYLRQLKPTVFEDIIAMVALYRPGPMQWIEDFIARKHGQKTIEYIHPIMKNSLENTYGVIVYQEQVMQISKDMCGFTGGQADTLRKGIGKKNPEVLAKLKNEFIEGAIKTVGADRKLMEDFWQQLMDFAAYCFNKVHSACYGLIAYQTAYLKANYPVEYMAALMTSDYDNIDRLAIEIAECRHMGIEVLSPDVNESFHEFAVIPGESKIRFGMDAIKNVGHGAVEEIIRARIEAGGKFKDLTEYAKQVNCRVVNRKPLDSLIKAGAFDSFGERSVLINNIDNILDNANRFQKAGNAGQVDLFGEGSSEQFMAKISLDTTGPEVTQVQILASERELLGIYLSAHPLENYEAALKAKAVPMNAINETMDGRMFTFGGAISTVREISTKNGSKMAFVKLADLSSEAEVIVFPKLYDKTGQQWQQDSVVLVKGKADYSRGELKILAEEIKPLSQTDTDGSPNQSWNDIKQRLYIRIEDSRNQPQLIDLKQKLDGHAGDTEVVLVTGQDESKQIIKLPQMIDINEQCLRELAEIFGSTNVVVR